MLEMPGNLPFSRISETKGKVSMTLPMPFQVESATLPIALPPGFERFYRAQLRRVVGSRLSSRAIFEAYASWAASAGEPGITFSKLRKMMALLGHRHIQSNGVHYADVGFSSDFPDVPDSLRTGLGGVVGGATAFASADALLQRVDALLAALLELRHEVIAGRDARDPVAAARRTLRLAE
ncbi:hypothetical protein [Sphingomonas sp. IW22]|uniref:hypothetical protein n=1 Tax=Sphingomonas sp. IW22 TaxID=3242489 RepID=UPI003520B18F